MLRGPLIELSPVSTKPDLALAGTGLFVVSTGIPRRVVRVAEYVFAENSEAMIDVQVMLGL